MPGSCTGLLSSADAAPLSIAVVADDDADYRGRALARRLRLPVVGRDAARGFAFVLEFLPEGLALRDQRDRRLNPVIVDFCNGPRRVSRRDPLVKAVGRRTERIVDATAGYGRDALHLSIAGYRVTAVERSPIIAALLRDGLTRGGASVAAAALVVIEADARRVLEDMTPSPDAVYLDPMYPPRTRGTALGRKALRMLRDIVGDDDDIGSLFAVALRSARRRVIVKRPRRAAVLAGPFLTSYSGKLVRYDVYRGSAP